MSVAAFFDMDRTLLRCNSGTLWVQYLRRRGELPMLKWLEAIGWLVQYKLAILDMEAVTGRVTARMAGAREQDTIDKCREFTEKLVLPEVAPKAREALARHRAEGHTIAILTGGTPYVSEPVARHLGIEHVLCTRLNVENGAFVGTHVRPACAGAGKVHWAEQFAREHAIDLERSFFYTDSFSDLPMLERVGQAKVVNPDTRLRRHARRVGWSVEEW